MAGEDVVGEVEELTLHIKTVCFSLKNTECSFSYGVNVWFYTWSAGFWTFDETTFGPLNTKFEKPLVVRQIHSVGCFFFGILKIFCFSEVVLLFKGPVGNI